MTENPGKRNFFLAWPARLATSTGLMDAEGNAQKDATTFRNLRDDLNIPIRRKFLLPAGRPLTP